MMTTTTTPNRASKDTLARLLASENITVQHQPVPTAAFDVASRTLILPIWKDMSNDLYDMLVMHEVGHALYTPAGEEALMSAINSIDSKNPAKVKQYLNICEDPRIERLIKKKFPGGRGQFARAYSDLWNRNFFGCIESDIKNKGFGDRANLHFKIGFLLAEGTIPFTAEEQAIIDSIEAATTWDDMVDCARRMYDLVPKDGTPEPMPEAGEGDDSDSSLPEDQDGEASSDADAGMPGDSDEDGDDQDSGSGAGESDESGEDSGMSMADDTDDGESAESMTGEAPADNQPGGEDEAGELPAGNGGVEAGTTPPAEDITTNDAFDKALEQCADLSQRPAVYATMPKTLNHDNVIIDYKEVNRGFMNTVDWNQPEVARRAKEFMNSTKPTVNTMVKQFEALMAADVDRRTAIGRSGVIDPNRLHAYTITEDIFLRRETISEGKNHGIVMFMDWSGSMQDVLGDVVKQVINLCLFCQKVNIPFEVYSFTSNLWYGDASSDEERAEVMNAASNSCEPGDINISKSGWSRSFQLHNWLSGRMNSREFNAAVTNLMAFTIDRWQDSGIVNRLPREFDLGSTPLNEALLAAQYIVRDFQKANNLQIVNTVILTDGEASGRPQSIMQEDGTFEEADYGHRLHITSRKTKKSYDMSDRATDELINMLRDETGANVIGMFLASGTKSRLRREVEHQISRAFYGDDNMDWTALENLTEKALAELKKENGTVAPHKAYDEYYILKGNQKVIDGNRLDELDSNASITKVRNAFIKSGNDKTSSRTILTRLAGVVART
tara:strand:- start:1403 stop:3754 length:2352 start_codon:yes stop_codon:yes gene_type:complete